MDKLQEILEVNKKAEERREKELERRERRQRNSNLKN